jgi:electron transfer flavoprotein alpha subunit
MSNTILVLAEQRLGTLNSQSIESIVAAQRLAAGTGGDVVVALMGNGIDAATSELAGADVARLVKIEHELLEPYTPDAFCVAARGLMDELQPQWVLLPHTYQVRDFAPRLAARHRRSLISDCTAFRIEAGEVVFEREILQGKTHCEVVAACDAPHFVSLQAGAFPAADLKTAAQPLAPEAHTAAITADQIRTRAEPPAQGGAKTVDLSQAQIIVSVGRGIGGPEHIDIARDLAKAIGGELGASRPVCDAQWLPIERQIGSSGQTVAPKLYVALGISGASQHLVGMKGSHTVVAVNKDAKAPIFKQADYGIVGDLTEVIPELIKALS